MQSKKFLDYPICHFWCVEYNPDFTCSMKQSPYICYCLSSTQPFFKLIIDQSS